jgi:hypothetical protein
MFHFILTKVSFFSWALECDIQFTYGKQSAKKIQYLRLVKDSYITSPTYFNWCKMKSFLSVLSCPIILIFSIGTFNWIFIIAYWINISFIYFRERATRGILRAQIWNIFMDSKFMSEWEINKLKAFLYVCF